MKFLLLLLIPLSTFAQQDRVIKRIDSIRYADVTRIWELERRTDSIIEVLKHCLQTSGDLAFPLGEPTYGITLTPSYTHPFGSLQGHGMQITLDTTPKVEPDSTVYSYGDILVPRDPEAKPEHYSYAQIMAVLDDTLTVFQGYPSKQGALYDVPGWANGVGKAIYLDGTVYYIHRRKDKTYYITKHPVAR